MMNLQECIYVSTCWENLECNIVKTVISKKVISYETSDDYNVSI